LRYGCLVSNARGFSRQQGSTTCGPKAPPSPLRIRAFLIAPHFPTGLAPAQPIAGWPTSLRPPIAPPNSTGILTCCPSPTPDGLGLGPTNPTRIDLASETLGIRRTRFSRVLRYSFRHSHFCTLHPSLRSSFYAVQNAPLPTYPKDKPRGFGAMLKPRYIFRAGPLDQ
jgi:hypothetical protein